MKKWSAIIILAVAQFVMVLDSTVMNVSMSTVASDLGTTITGMQAAITFYTLTMAALMLTGAKLGDIWGRINAFRIGAVVYGIGSLITGLSGSLGMLMFGWSLVEGLGAVLVIPAIAALAAINYKGKDRVIAFSIIGAVSGLAAACGPLIGGYVTTYLSWRYVFFAETIVMVFVLMASKRLVDVKTKKKPKLNISGALLSTAGMAILVLGILQSKTWGWVHPIAVPTINGQEVAPFGISLVAYLILIGSFLLWLFINQQRRLEEQKKDGLLKVSLLKISVLKSGLRVLGAQYFVIAAIFFTVPVYLQTVLGLNALDTGIKIMPLSVGLILCSVLGSKMIVKHSSRRVVRLGQILLVLGTVTLFTTLEPSLNGAAFALGMFITGAGLGLLASQLGNINMSAVSKEDTAEAGGLQGTFQNLGSSLGTALIGSVFVASLLSNFTSSINQSNLPSEVKTQISQSTENGIGILPASQVEAAALEGGASQEEAQEISSIYLDSEVQGLKEAMFFLSIVGVLSIILSRDLPSKDPDEK